MNEDTGWSDHLDRIVADVARERRANDIPYTQAQLRGCVVSLIQLWEVSKEEDVLSLFGRLLEESIHQVQPWEWIGTELGFELLVAVTGNRPAAALTQLRRVPLNDASLDRYNQRISRFNES